MIREAVRADIPHLVVMGLHFIRSTDYAGQIGENPDALFNMMLNLIDSDQAVVFVVDSGNPTGMLGAYLLHHPMSNELIACELFWWVEPGTRGNGMKLMDAFQDWAKEKHVQKIQMIAPNDKTARVYKSFGFHKIEEFYQKDI